MVALALAACGGGGGGGAGNETTGNPQPPAANPPTLNFTAGAGAMMEGQRATLRWASTQAQSCTASGAWAGTQATSGERVVNPAVGPHTFVLECTGAGGRAVAQVVLEVAAAPPTLSLAATPTALVQGETVALNWTSTRASTCVAGGAWAGPKATQGTESLTPAAGNAVFELTCTGPGGTATATAQVVVAAAPGPTLNFTAGANALTEGQSTTLRWASTLAQNCTASGAWAGSQATSGERLVSPAAGTQSYMLECNGAVGRVVAQVVLQVAAAPPTLSLAATPTALVQGQTLALNWSSARASTCVASGAWAGPKATQGTESVRPTAGTAVFELTCTGPGGTATASAQVAVAVAPVPPVVSLVVAPANRTAGQSASLQWAATAATACTASGAWAGSRASSGTQSVAPAAGTHEYRLSCTGPGGTQEATATLVVVAAPLAPQVQISAAPLQLTAGQSTTLTWAATGATACTAGGAWAGAKASNGSLQVQPGAGSSTFVLTCTGPGGTAVGSVVANVQAPAPQQPTLTMGFGTGTITAGSSATLQWSSTNASSCTAGNAWAGAQAATGSRVFTPAAGTHFYGLTCTGESGSVTGLATLLVQPVGAPPLTIGFTPSVVTLGQPATLQWAAPTATSCTASAGWSGSQPSSGSAVLTANAVGFQPYGISCTGPAGTVSTAAYLQVIPAYTATVDSITCGADSNNSQLLCRVLGTGLPNTTSLTATNCSPAVMTALPSGTSTQREFVCHMGASGGYSVTPSVPGSNGVHRVAIDRFLAWGSANTSIPSSGPATTCTVPAGGNAQDNVTVGPFKVYAGDCVASYTLDAATWAAVMADLNALDQRSIQRAFSRVFKDEVDFLVMVLDTGSNEPAANHPTGQYTSLATRLPRIRRMLGGMVLTYPQTAYGQSLLAAGPLLHEFLHEWANLDALPTAYGAHWGFASVGGQLGGFYGPAGVQNLGAGVFEAQGVPNTCLPAATAAQVAQFCSAQPGFGLNTAGGNRVPYAPLELFLMGLVPDTQVPPVQVANQAAWLAGSNSRFTASSFTTYTAAQIAASLGAAAPQMATAQRSFRMATVVLTPKVVLDASLVQLLNTTIPDATADRAPNYGNVSNVYLYAHNFYSGTNGLATLRGAAYSTLRRTGAEAAKPSVQRR